MGVACTELAAATTLKPHFHLHGFFPPNFFPWLPAAAKLWKPFPWSPVVLQLQLEIFEAIYLPLLSSSGPTIIFSTSLFHQNFRSNLSMEFCLKIGIIAILVAPQYALQNQCFSWWRLLDQGGRTSVLLLNISTDWNIYLISLTFLYELTIKDYSWVGFYRRF